MNSLATSSQFPDRVAQRNYVVAQQRTLSLSFAMNADQFRDACLALPDVTESFPFGPDALVFKVREKMFALISLSDIPPRVNIKCDPAEALELRANYASVLPGYHMSKKHWNTVVLDQSIASAHLQQWLLNSYVLVAKGLRAADRNAVLAQLPTPNEST